MYRYYRLLFCLLGLLLPSLLVAAPRKKEQTAQGAASVASSSAPKVTHLTTEGRVAPLGLDETTPRFGWQLSDSLQGLVQTGYRLLVASHPDSLRLDRGDLWDSGAVRSDRSQWVAYAGKPLRPNQDCYWKVRLLTNHGTTDWSAPAHWSVGLLSEGRWQGQWIGCDRPFVWDQETAHSRLSARYLRRTFALRGPVRRATLHIAGLGRYEAYINGVRIGRSALAPAPTDFRKSIIYNTYDVTALLPTDVLTLPSEPFPPRRRTATVHEPAATRVCLAVNLGNGRFYAPQQHTLTHLIPNFGYPKLRANLILEYADGSQEVVATDEAWKLTAAGPIRTNNERDGETYDATRLALMADWMQPDYNDDFWLDVEPVSVPDGTLVGNVTPSVEVVDTLRPRAVQGQILDFGRVLTGRLRLPVAGLRSGTQVQLRYAVVLDDDGTLYFDDADAADASDCYIASGHDSGSWTPSFVAHTFRYVELSGYPMTAAADFVAEVLSDPMPRTGFFACSDSTLNRYVDEAYHRLRSEYQGLPLTTADGAPQPYLADRAHTCLGENYLLDNATLYAKWLADIAQSQRSDGAIPDVAPAFLRSFSADTLGPSLLSAAAEMLYQQRGDDRPRSRYADALRRWRAYCAQSDAEEVAYALPFDTLSYCFAQVGGIRPLSPGYRQILLAPDFRASGLTVADVSYDAPYGRIRSSWQRTDTQVAWDVTIPGNTTARLLLPEGIRLETLQGVAKSLRKKIRDRRLTLGSGQYHLTFQIADP
jgi:alpha-L-rhamnosidase